MNRLRFGFALAGFTLAVVSITLDDHRLAWAAIAVLAASFIIRLVQRNRQGRKSQGDNAL